MPQASSLKNHFLIALPSLADPNFSHTVTYICEHDSQGAMGIIVNRPSQLQLKDILESMEITDQEGGHDEQTVYLGGPVEEHRGFVLHTQNQPWEATLSLSEKLSITTSRDILEAIANGYGPEQSLVALGYAGWGPGQLEQELQQDSWLSAPADSGIIFDVSPEQRWLTAAQTMGIDLNLITTTAGHA